MFSEIAASQLFNVLHAFSPLHRLIFYPLSIQKLEYLDKIFHSGIRFILGSFLVKIKWQRNSII